jgi:alkylresorcinol/alkylpyrone synthase
MYLDDDPGVLISACLFGDGAGAAVLSRTRPAQGRCIQWRHTASLTDPAARDSLRFEQRGGLLRNILTPAVPRLAAETAHEVFARAMAKARLQPADISGWIFHAGGRDVLQAIGQDFGLSPESLRHSAAMLKDYGNLSSAFVYFVLDAALADDAPGGWWWMSSFGAGFTCHGALLSVE